MKKGDLSKIIREERIKQGISQQELADKAGVTKRSVVYWETQGREITIEYADKVLKALGVSVVLGVGVIEEGGGNIYKKNGSQ